MTSATVKRRKPSNARRPADARERRRRPSGRASREERAVERVRSINRRGMPKRRSIAVMLITGMIFLIVLAYIVNSAMVLSDRSTVASVAVQMGYMDVPLLLSGVIIRDESVYHAEKPGVVEYNYNDLERVHKGATICSVRDGQSAEELESRVEAIEKDILRLQERRMDISAFKKDVDNVYLQIKSAVDNKSQMSMQGDFAAVHEVKEAITQNLKLRNQILLNESRGSLSTLASERQLYENERLKNYSDITALESGVLSYVVDGYEEKLTVDMLGSIMPEVTRMTVDFDKLVRSRNVNAEDPVFKLVRSNDWYIATYIPVEQIFDWEEGDTRTVYIQSGSDFSDVEMQVERIVPQDTDYYVVLKSSKSMIDYIHMRNVRFKITNSEHRGYKIPSAAIVDQTLLKVPLEYVIEEDDGFYVFKHAEPADEKIAVKVQSKDGDWFYISQEMNRLVLHDQVKLPHEPYDVLSLSDVANVKGVYVVNRGYAEFKRIYLDPRMPVAGDYVILDPARNPELRLHDRISADASTMNEQQKVVQ